jgi:hypothetical protein
VAGLIKRTEEYSEGEKAIVNAYERVVDPYLIDKERAEDAAGDFVKAQEEAGLNEEETALLVLRHYGFRG